MEGILLLMFSGQLFWAIGYNNYRWGVDYFAKRYELSAVELLYKLKRGYRVHLKDSRTGFTWQSDVLLEKRLQKILDSLNSCL